jgi:hypothetical protein
MAVILGKRRAAAQQLAQAQLQSDVSNFISQPKSQGAVAVGSGARLCKNSFFDHPIHLLDSSKCLTTEI